MTEPEIQDNDRKRKRRLGAVGLLAAGAVAGGVLAGTLSANAAGSDSSSNSGTATPPSGHGLPFVGGRPGGPRTGGAAPVRPDETQLTGSDAEKARAAALEAVPGGTVYRVETDAGDAAYEAHMTKANGTPVTVKLDKNFNVIRVEQGMGRGDPAPTGTTDNSGSSSSTSSETTST